MIFSTKFYCFLRYKDKVTQMQLICIYAFTQKQSREGHEEEWHGVYPCHAESLGRRNNSIRLSCGRNRCSMITSVNRVAMNT